MTEDYTPEEENLLNEAEVSSLEADKVLKEMEEMESPEEKHSRELTDAKAVVQVQKSPEERLAALEAAAGLRSYRNRVKLP